MRAEGGARLGDFMWARALALELILWSLIPAAFLATYVTRFGVSPAAVLPHLRVVFAVYCALALVRISLWSSVRSPAVSRASTAAVLAAVLCALLVYYGAVLIGLHAWGRVITWQLISTYALQAASLADALGVAPVVPAFALASAYLLLLAIVWACLLRADWTQRFVTTLSTPVVRGAAIGLSVFLIFELVSFVLMPPVLKGEPLSLTLFHERAATDSQYHTVDVLRAHKIDALDERARSAYRPQAPAHRRNVVLIVVDALRPDHMGVYGYARDTTPHLSELASRGMVRTIERVYATCSNSACGLFSLGTSKYLHEYSVKPFTLQEALKRHDYRIHFILSGDHVSFYGLKEMYGRMDSYFDGSMSRSYPNSDALVLDRAAALPAWDGVPVMMQFHLMSVHVIGQRDERFMKYRPAANYSFSTGGTRQSAINYYDNGVLQADSVIRDLLETLRGKGYLENTLVVITADHGEALGERGVYAHSNGVDEEVLRIPFLLVAFGYEPPRLSDEVKIASQVDIAPTILADLTLPVPATWSGLPLQHGGTRSHVYFQDRFAAGFVDQRQPASVWKYAFNVTTRTESAFHLSTDPNAQRNVIDAAPVALKREWRLKYVEMMPAASAAPVDEDASPAR